MNKSTKIILTASAVILLAAGCSRSQTAQQTNTPAQNQQQSANASPGGTQPDEPNMITVYQTVQGSNFNDPSYQVGEGTSAMALLKTSHQVVAKDYNGLGEMVTAIDGIKSDSKHFWAFYVNGKSGDVGASSYKPKDGDKLEWKLEAIN